MALIRKQIMASVESSADEDTQVSEVFQPKNGTQWSVHLDWTEVVATYTATVTLWVSNHESPSTDDTDWVQLTANHGFQGLPGGDPAGGDGKDFLDFYNTMGLNYRIKIERVSGEALVDVRVASQ